MLLVVVGHAIAIATGLTITSAISDPAMTSIKCSRLGWRSPAADPGQPKIAITSASSIAHMSTAVMTITKHDKHQAILAAVKTNSTNAVAADRLTITSASSAKLQVISAAMNTTSSLHVMAAGAGDHH